MVPGCRSLGKRLGYPETYFPFSTGIWLRSDTRASIYLVSAVCYVMCSVFCVCVFTYKREVISLSVALLLGAEPKRLSYFPAPSEL